MNDKPIPRMKTNRKNIDRIFGMFAGLQELEYASKEMEARFRAIPNGWRDLKMIISRLDKLIDGLMATVPVEKLSSMQRMLPHMKFKLLCGIQASTMGEDDCIISLVEANTLARYAHEQCKFCINGSCSQCPLGKVLDSILSYERDGTSWSLISLDAISETYRSEDKKEAKK